MEERERVLGKGRRGGRETAGGERESEREGCEGGKVSMRKERKTGE